MGHLNFSKYEIDAINAVDASALDAAISHCLDNRNSLALSPFGLDSCGAYVARKLHEFESALRAFAVSKAPKKTESTGASAYQAGSSLSSAFRRTREALEKEVQDGELFRVFDDVIVPMNLRASMSVCVSFRWRADARDAWVDGSIKFTHTVVPRTDYLHPSSKRKPSAAVENREHQDKLYAEWDHLKRLALWSVRDFFRSGGTADDVPAVFPVVLDSYSRQLNNYSANFWRHTAERDA
ncbi:MULTISPECIES: hypothetical protein [Stenotrophomonas]|uniref:hypothetical protein n=1 Tax=Stenotrophomonas TaxID=40323 RepID=UPI00081BEB0D|nr:MULTISPECIES: hypothetical protein [Stenotrophomonas]